VTDDISEQNGIVQVVKSPGGRLACLLV
jgi:hypothetical protein